MRKRRDPQTMRDGRTIQTEAGRRATLQEDDPRTRRKRVQYGIAAVLIEEYGVTDDSSSLRAASKIIDKYPSLLSGEGDG